jgi:hypothetical protein
MNKAEVRGREQEKDKKETNGDKDEEDKQEMVMINI